LIGGVLSTAAYQMGKSQLLWTKVSGTAYAVPAMMAMVVSKVGKCMMVV
jgi:hypothetical protein